MSSGISFKLSDPATIPLPSAGKATLFIDNTTGEPSFKDDGGVVESLKGEAGVGVPAGGNTSQVLAKASGTDYDTEWVNPSGGGTWGSITGTLSSQTDLQNALDAKEGTVSAGTTAQYYRGDKTWQTLNKSAVGLGNVDNTSDANKPISTAVSSALAGKANTSHNHNASDITAGTLAVARGGTGLTTLGSANQVLRVNSAGTALEYGTPSSGVAWGAITGDILDQSDLHGMLDSKAFVYGTPNSSFEIAIDGVTQKGSLVAGSGELFYDETISRWESNSNIYAPSFVGSGGSLTNLNADNISAGTLPIARGGTGLTALGTAGQVMRVNSGATGLEWHTPSSGGGVWGSITGTLSAQTDLQNALDAKEGTITAGTTAQYWRGDKSWQTLNKAAVGLGNVDNTSDANKPISTAVSSALAGKANLTGGNTFSGNQTFNSGHIDVTSGSLGVSGSINADQNITAEGTVTATDFVGDGSALTDLDADNISAGTLPIARGGTGLTALGSANQVLRVNSAGTALEYGTVSSGGGAWGSITGTLSSQTDLQNALDGKQALNSKLTALGNLSALGFMVHRGSGEYVTRGISGGSGIIVAPSTANGVDGNPLIMLDSTVVATLAGAQTFTGVKTFNVQTKLCGVVFQVRNISSNDTLLLTDYYISLTPHGGAFTLTLPSATASIGQTYYGEYFNNGSANAVTFDAGSGYNISGPGSYAQTYVGPTSSPSRWFRITKIDAGSWVISTGEIS